MESSLASHGYSGLFVLSFLASTLLPVGSEWLLVLMLLKGNDPFSTVSVATVGNYLGSCTTWAIGIWGGPLLIRRVLRIDPATEEAAVRFYRRYGVWSLLLSWMPIIGDPLTLVAGVLREPLPTFIAIVTAAKLGRYLVLAAVTLQWMA